MGFKDYTDVIVKMRNEIEKVVKKEEICGLAIALVDQDEIIWSEGFGITDYKTKKKVTADTLFSTQSMGKTITATCFMIMASKDLIKLDDPIRKYYPEFTVNTKFGDKEKEMEKITFRRMLGHLAGFTHEAPIGNNFDDEPCTMEEHIKSINNTWLRSKVGTELAYSNLGYDLTAYVLSLIKKKSFTQTVKEELFKPIGIKTATIDIKEALNHSFAKGHIGKFETPTVQVPMLGAGGVYISVNDQAKFAILFLNKGKVKGKQLINKDLFNEMHKSQFEEEGIKSKFGLGIYKEDPIDDNDVFCHGGGGYGYLTQHTWMPKQKIAAIVFTNSMHHEAEQTKLARKALELMYKEKTKPVAIKVPSDKLARLTGTYYRQRVDMQNIVFEKDKLVRYNMFGKRLVLYPQSELEFLDEVGDKYVFEMEKQEQKAKYMKLITKKAAYKLKQNDSLIEQKGPNEKEWKKLVGIYQSKIYGILVYIGIGIFNGHLYLYSTNKIKLDKYLENLYFTLDGESAKFRNGKIVYSNITYIKVDLNLEEIITEYKANKDKKHAYKWAIMDVIGILYWKNGFEDAYGFLEKAIEANEFFKTNLMTFGNLLYFYRDVEKAKICYEKLKALDEKDEKAVKMLERIDKVQ
jgi:CubicO group peptidase (beta-lactamase class C family)